MGVLGVRIYHASEHFRRELGAEVDNVARKAARIDLGGVDSNDGHVLGVLFGASTDGDGG